MTVCDVLKKAESSQWMKITGEARGNVCGTALLLYKSLNGEIMNMEVGMIRAENGVIVVEVAEE